MTAQGRTGRWLAFLLAVAVALSGCGIDSSSDDSPTLEETHLADLEAELERQVVAGLAAELPRPMDREEGELVELIHYRRRIADDMRQSVQSAVTPLAIAAAVFAINGPADLLLAVVPVRVLGKGADVAKRGLQARSRSRRSRQLVAWHRKLNAALPAHGQEFLRLAGALKAADRTALKIIHKRVGDHQVIYTLMRRHLDGTADVQWIASKLQQGKFDRTFTRRYTFDADIVQDITEHDSHISWNTLKAVVEGEVVSETARAALRSKLAGLMGERLARERVLLGSYADKVLKLAPGDELVAKRGLRYSGGSLDIAAYSNKQRAVFVEVKNWGTTSWEKNGRSVLAQLRRHDRGIAEKLADGDEVRTLAGKMLIVTRQGFYGWAENKRNEFIAEVKTLGWQLDLMDGSRIKDFRTIIDELR